MSNQTITVVIPKELYEWLMEYSSVTGISINSIVSLSLEAFRKNIDRGLVVIEGEMIRGFTHIFVSDIVYEMIRFIEKNNSYHLNNYLNQIFYLLDNICVSLNRDFLPELYKGKFKDSIEWGALYTTEYHEKNFGKPNKVIYNGMEIWGLLIRRKGKHYKITLEYDDREKHRIKVTGKLLDENPINNPKYRISIRLKP